MHPMLRIAERAAREAGKLITRNIDNLDPTNVEEKKKDDLVTNIDRQCEQVIAETILKSYRDHSVLGEEGGLRGNPETEYQWIIDPIDGTTNFVKGIAHVAVSIAVTRNGKLEAGLVFDPILNEVFSAARGEGAFLNGRRIRVSGRDSLDGTIIGTAFPTRYRDRMLPYMELFTRLIANCADVRRMGAASLDLCYVACGRFDGYLEQGLKRWDFAAGELILREAGGIVTDFMGENNYIKSGNVVSGNPKIVRALLKICDPQSLNAILR